MSDQVTKCAAQHFGPWLIEPQWMHEAVSAVKAGTFKAAHGDNGEGGKGFSVMAGGIAYVPIFGQLVKGDSSFGGTSMVRVKRAIRMAARDESIEGILIHIDSPGGTVAGAFDLADEIKAARGVKPVFAHIDDMGASGGFLQASQADYIAANANALVGSLGVVTQVVDTSGAMDKAGVKVHVISTGPYKGAGADGAPVTDEQLADMQGRVDDLNELFIAAVRDGRGMDEKELRTLFDGRVHISEKAQRLGLIDAVQSFDATVAKLTETIMSDKPIAEQATALKETNADLYDHIWTDGKGLGVDEGVESGKAEGYAEGRKHEQDRMAELAEAFPNRPAFAIEQFISGHGVAKATEALAPILAAETKAKDDRIAALEKQLAESAQGETGIIIAREDEIVTDTTDDIDIDAITDPKERATAEWAAMPADERNNYISEAVFVAARKRELSR